MIENLFGGGGGGGTVDTIQAGTGISVDATNPASPIITNTSLNTDEVAKVSSNDTTAGYLNGKLVAGSGIALTENNNGGNETLGISVSNLDASAITTGTVATARLGSGTANSTTYLAGDQTYKAAVTSVNGSTGAVTVAAGDATYTITTADSENSALRVRMIAVTIPANTWADGERISIEVLREMSNQSGSTYSSEAWIGGTGLVEFVQNAQNVSTGTLTSQLHRFDFIRAGGNVYMSRMHPNLNFPLNYHTGFNVGSGSALFTMPISTGVNFGTNITLYIDHRWNIANATVYQRVLWAKCYKSSAGQQ
jgi:hypothetical protein